VLEAAVIAIPDAPWGEALKPVVVLKPEAMATSAALIDHCKERLAPYKVPKSVAIVASLPHTEVGKVNKVKVREMFSLREGSS
jgi:fatty-acyl-CoA synthase